MGKASEAYGSGSSNPSDAAVPAFSSNNPFRRFFKRGHEQQRLGTDNTYEPPPGPPPSKKTAEASYVPPSGPPPSHQSSKQSYAPPPGPPPSQSTSAQDSDPPPYDPWLSVPESNGLPPPPSMSYDTSPTSNASADLANMGREFTRFQPLYAPGNFSGPALSDIQSGHVQLSRPPTFRGALNSSRIGTQRIRTALGTPDTVLHTTLPIYAARASDPSLTGRSVTVYFEVKINHLDTSSTQHDEVGSAVAVGLLAPPYPPFRLPGWDRASLGVHSDDGRRYINNNCGGIDFTTHFVDGEVVGVGMKLSPPRYAGGKNAVECFFTRNGTRTGSWDLWEERDAADTEGDPEGLGGDRDLCAAVGFFGAIDVEFRARRDEWLYRPDLH